MKVSEPVQIMLAAVCGVIAFVMIFVLGFRGIGGYLLAGGLVVIGGALLRQALSKA